MPDSTPGATARPFALPPGRVWQRDERATLAQPVCFGRPGRLARIAAVDSAVCLLLGALRSGRGPIALEPTLNSVVARIHRDEARHVAVTSRYVAELTGAHRACDDVAEVRHRLTPLLARRGSAMEDLGVDPDRLFRSLRAIPRALRR